MTSRLAIAVFLALPLAACGSGNSADEAPATEASAAPDAMASEAPAPAASETPTAEATEAATPTPTPSATASATPTPTPTPTKVAAAGPPEAFKQCSVCHSTEPGKALIGPSLAGVVGRKAGSVAGFKYSPAMASSGLTWSASELDTYLTDPKKEVPGTTMAFAGVKDAGKRADIIAYLKTL